MTEACGGVVVSILDWRSRAFTFRIHWCLLFMSCYYSKCKVSFFCRFPKPKNAGEALVLGTKNGIKLSASIVGLLIVSLALIELLNKTVEWFGDRVDIDITLNVRFFMLYKMRTSSLLLVRLSGFVQSITQTLTFKLQTMIEQVKSEVHRNCYSPCAVFYYLALV